MAANESRVVLEYPFKGYSPPDHPLEDFGVACRVTSAAGVGKISSTGDLSGMRAELEERGFERHGAEMLDRYVAGNRYDPKWREVWVRDRAEEASVERPKSLGGNLLGYSPQVQKRLEASRAAARCHNPTIARTGDRAIVYRPRWAGRRVGKLFAQDMAASLPQFAFNPKKDRWEAPLDQLPVACDAFKPHVNLSDGARKYLEEVGCDAV